MKEIIKIENLNKTYDTGAIQVGPCSAGDQPDHP